MKYDTIHPLNYDDLHLTNLPSDNASQDKLIKLIQKLDFKLPLHVMVQERSNRNHGAKFICHLASKTFPPGSIIKISEEICIISPEYCLLQAAKELDIAELAILATDFMGIYKLSPEKKIGLSNRTPLTSFDKISTFLLCAKSCHGVKAARTAINYAFENSNSPMESKLAVVACLPCMYGGYGILRPELNGNLKLSQDARILMQRESCCCDMIWRSQSFVVEYDSDLIHSSPSQVRYDKRRSDAVLISGLSLLHVTRDYFHNENTINALFILIRKCLGMRSINPKLEKYRDIRFELLKKLFLTL